MNKGDFIGREALVGLKAAGLQRRLCTVTVACEPIVYGGEAVYVAGELAGRLRSAGYGYTVGQVIGLVYLPLALAQSGTTLEVEVFGERVRREVAADVPYDPRGERVRA